MELVFELINTIRNMRAELEVNLSSWIDIQLTVADQRRQQSLEPLAGYIKNLAKVNNLTIAGQYTPRNNQYVALLKDLHVVMLLEGVVDVAEQLQKTNLKIDKLKTEIKKNLFIKILNIFFHLFLCLITFLN